MKRFYCVVCQKIKRVRRLPPGLECRWHSSNKSHAQFTRDGRVISGMPKPRYQKAKPTPSAPRPQKRGRRPQHAEAAEM